MLGYLCAYYRYYYPIEYITSFLNNAANDEDIRNGTAYAERVGIKVTMPRWGVSRGDYCFDKDRNVIAKGLSSIKYMSANLADELYKLARSKEYTYFTDLLNDINKHTSLNTRQLDILVKIDFFVQFGNQRELLRIIDLYYETFKCGQAKQINKNKISSEKLEAIIKKYSVDVTKSGGVAKSYTLLDIDSILHESEDTIRDLKLNDFSDVLKVKNFKDVMGYAGYVSNKDEDRRKLYIMDVYPLVRKRDSKQFGYSIITKSIGSGKESRFTVFNKLFNDAPIEKDTIIYCKSYEKDGQYFRLTGYDKIY